MLCRRRVDDEKRTRMGISSVGDIEGEHTYLQLLDGELLLLNCCHELVVFRHLLQMMTPKFSACQTNGWQREQNVEQLLIVSSSLA